MFKEKKMGFLVFLVIVAGIIAIVVVVNKNRKKRKIEELKDSNSYATALEIKEMLEKMGKGCNFWSFFNFDPYGDAYAYFHSNINIPSETEKSKITIHTTKYAHCHEEYIKYSLFREVKKGCILDTGGCWVYSEENSPELIDGVFKKIFISLGGCNMYVDGKLTSKPSDSLTVYNQD
jgi:hypothetical protein